MGVILISHGLRHVVITTQNQKAAECSRTSPDSVNTAICPYIAMFFAGDPCMAVLWRGIVDAGCESPG